MLELSFRIESCRPDPVALAPQLLFGLRITASAPVHAMMLRCQARIRPSARQYRAAEQDRLIELFDTPDRWGDTLRDMQWMQLSVAVPGFADATLVEMPVPCSHDFDLATTKLFDALEGGDIPLAFLFSGTVFYEGAGGALQVAQVPWDHDAHYRLPVSVWKRLMERHYPDHAWLCLPRDVFERLRSYKRATGLATLADAVEDLITVTPPAATGLAAAGTTTERLEVERRGFAT